MVDMYAACMQHRNCRVRVHTRDGCCYEGVIVDVDRNNVYLRMAGRVRTSAWGGYGGYGIGANDILTLSLFTLLAIALV